MASQTRESRQRRPTQPRRSPRQPRQIRRAVKAAAARPTVRAPREAAIWHGANTRNIAEVERTPVQQVNVRRLNVSGRLLSGGIVIALVGVLAIFFSSDAFFVHSIGVAGQRYLDETEIFTLSNAAGLHVFWVDPAAVRADLLRSPTIADATVTVGWGTPMVQIVVEEREPALLWEQGGISVWVDVHGRIMRQREMRDDLLHIAVDGMTDGPPQGEVALDAVEGALQLHQLLPDVETFRFDMANGLGYADPRGWTAWFGTGADMPDKVLVYEALINDLQARGVRATTFYLINPDRPWYATL